MGGAQVSLRLPLTCPPPVAKEATSCPSAGLSWGVPGAPGWVSILKGSQNARRRNQGYHVSSVGSRKDQGGGLWPRTMWGCRP